MYSADSRCRYITVDYERSNFSISQCLFQEGSQQKLVGIPPVNNTAPGSTSNAPASKFSSHTTIIAVVVAVVVFVLLVIAAIWLFFYIKRRNKKRKVAQEKATAAREAEENAERIRLGFEKGEMDTSADHALYEMAGSAVRGLHAGAGGPLHPDWVKEKAALAHLAGAHELTGNDRTLAELGDRKRTVHEMYDPSAAPVELPADMPGELPGSIPSRRVSRASKSTPSFHSARRPLQERSTPTSPLSSQSAEQRTSRRNTATSPISSPSGGRTSQHHSTSSSPISRPSAVVSPVDRRIGRTPQSRSSALNSQRSAPSSTSGPSSPSDRSVTASPRSGHMFSPISPVDESYSEGRSPFEQRPLVAMLQGLSQPTPSPRGSPRRSQYESRFDMASHITSQRADSERRRRRNEF